MARVIVSREDLEALYPGSDLEGFEPNFRIEHYDPRTRKVYREDLVRLEEGNSEVRYAYLPGREEPSYANVRHGAGERWQCLDVHGVVRASPVRFRPDYVRPNDRVGHVYFVQSEGPARSIKIGWSQDVDRRVLELQTANAFPLRVLGKIEGTLRDEAALHVRFAHLRLEAEWFRDDEEIHRYLEQNGSGPIRDAE